MQQEESVKIVLLKTANRRWCAVFFPQPASVALSATQKPPSPPSQHKVIDRATTASNENTITFSTLSLSRERRFRFRRAELLAECGWIGIPLQTTAMGDGLWERMICSF